MAFVSVQLLSPLLHISAARDIVFRYMTLHDLLLNILFVAMFGVLSLVILTVHCLLELLYVRHFSQTFYAS